MFQNSPAFSSFSVNNLEEAKVFYSDTLGLNVTEISQMGILNIKLANGGEVMIYPKDDHVPATYTVLNFPVQNTEEAVDQLTAKGIVFEQYHSEYLQTDAKGISREGGQSMAWFKDPAGNILSVLKMKK